MQQHPPTGNDFNLWDEDGLIFDESPELFVLLDVEPIVFTVRGIRYFSPRFKQVGIDPASLVTKVDFMLAFNAWMEVERVLIFEKVEREATATTAANSYQLMQAIINGDLETAEAVVRRLEHRSLAGLKLVRGSAGE